MVLRLTTKIDVACTHTLWELECKDSFRFMIFVTMFCLDLPAARHVV